MGNIAGEAVRDRTAATTVGATDMVPLQTAAGEDKRVPLSLLLGGGIGAVRDASIVVGAEVSNARAITIQLKDESGADIAVREAVWIAVLLDANGDAFVTTGGSTGIAIGTDGALLPVVAKKLFLAISEADGDIDLTWTDTGTEAAYLAVILPGGKMIISTALTNA
jgi:hypothetical protein